MKYIKAYESIDGDRVRFVSNIIQTIKDILLEVEDLGYETHVYDTCLIIHKPDNKNININEIRDCLLRLKDYLGDKYYDCLVCVDIIRFDGTISTEWKEIDLNENTSIYSFKRDPKFKPNTSSMPLSGTNIDFKKVSIGYHKIN
jgi:uncharacterized protein (UPF0335 family)